MDGLGIQLHIVSAVAISLGFLLRYFLHRSEADQMQFWRIATTEFLVLGFISLVAVAFEVSFESKTADLGNVAEGLGFLMPMSESLTYWTTDLGFLRIISKTWF